MMSYQAVALADQNGKTYESIYGTYNKEDGFNIDYKFSLLKIEDLLYRLLHEDCWSLRVEKEKVQEVTKPKRMTKEEIENELGYEIEICNEKDKINRNARLEAILKNSGDRIFEDFFGLW